MTQGFDATRSAVRAIFEDRADLQGFTKLNPRGGADPMKLYPSVLKELDNYFLIRGLTYLPGQRELLSDAVEAVLTAAPETVTAIPFQPGLSKSTMIRASLKVFAREFRSHTLIAQRIGGVITVVEKTAEAEELEKLCNGPGGWDPVAKAISAPNDYNLAQGKCMNGTATSYQECPGRSCPDYADCELAQSASQIHDTPILIMLHARYKRYMENMSPFLTWENADGQHVRTLLLVDELPPMIEDLILNLGTTNRIETMFDQLKPSYQVYSQKEKYSLLYEWGTSIRTPYLKLVNTVRKSSGMYGMVSRRELEEAGFLPEKLQALKEAVIKYLGTENHEAVQLINALMTHENTYYAIGQEISLCFPRLKKLSGEMQPATFLFSGTASLSPELSKNPDVISLPDRNLESFRRLQINIQRSDLFNTSKSGLEKKRNLSATIAWLQYMLPQVSQRHNKLLLVSYKGYAQQLWDALQDFHSVLIRYIDSNGQPQPKLPYFGGMNGSNLYRESTCVICVGLNRFEPRDYINRALALDFDRSCRNAIETALETQEGNVPLASLPAVLDMQDITLASEIVQLVFRSALRNHGETQPIELWLLQPPNGVVGYLKNYFGDCQVQEFTELPEICHQAVAIGREYMGNQTHAGKLLDYLTKLEDEEQVTPNQIRDATGLTQGQFKEAKKHPAVKDYFKRHIKASGSGPSTKYTNYVELNQEPDRQLYV